MQVIIALYRHLPSCSLQHTASALAQELVQPNLQQRPWDLSLAPDT